MEPEFLGERNYLLGSAMIRTVLLMMGLLTLLLAPPLTWASQEGIKVVKNWKQEDLCAKKAQEAFPDHTAEAAAKREAQLKACLANGNYAPRAPQ
jgi:hypothetical protein